MLVNVPVEVFGHKLMDEFAIESFLRGCLLYFATTTVVESQDRVEC
jgi:hypothetical protein